MSLSDLDLVSQAMASSEPPNARGATNPITNGSSGGASSGADKSTADVGVIANGTNANGTNANGANTNATADDSIDSVAGIDLSSLSVEERTMLAPIIDALRASSDDSLDVEDIMKQLDAAGNVADTIEGRLDSLLDHLGELEAQATASDKKA
ncbi:hypothetical protein CspeluHIS016_0406360 [Cutaneotrichosporon spelunceum]|uniref:Uncharacterized protein n=1 Tax=Cutaneotrichosporon spelunceum TaxID=1672016 RepID=A0AAD3YDC2_9TREE|nr:hypothetical protein CspeluHIS016_0406360 [Cutaneotrichosporon spelunceum]